MICPKYVLSYRDRKAVIFLFLGFVFTLISLMRSRACIIMSVVLVVAVRGGLFFSKKFKFTFMVKVCFQLC